MTDKNQPLLTHLTELRYRLMISLGAVFIMMVVALGFAQYILTFLEAPILPIMENKGIHFVVLSPLEQPITYLKVAFFSGLIVSMPIVLTQIYAFIAPGLLEHEKRFMIPFAVFGTIFFFGGLVFAYYIVIPLGIGFLIDWLPQQVVATFSVEKYFTLIIRLLLGFGIMFETPLVVMLVIGFGLIQADVLARYRKFVIVGAFIISAFLTPMDPGTQVAMAIPLILFFEIGLLLGRVFKRRREKNK